MGCTTNVHGDDITVQRVHMVVTKSLVTMLEFAGRVSAPRRIRPTTTRPCFMSVVLPPGPHTNEGGVGAMSQLQLVIMVIACGVDEEFG